MAFKCPCGTSCSIWCHGSRVVCAVPLVCNKHVGLRHICLAVGKPCSAAVHHFHPQLPHPPPAVHSQSFCTYARTHTHTKGGCFHILRTPTLHGEKLPLFEWVPEPAVLSALCDTFTSWCAVLRASNICIQHTTPVLTFLCCLAEFAPYLKGFTTIV